MAGGEALQALLDILTSYDMMGIHCAVHWVALTKREKRMAGHDRGSDSRSVREPRRQQYTWMNTFSRTINRVVHVNKMHIPSSHLKIICGRQPVLWWFIC